jgi:hypothetical protein
MALRRRLNIDLEIVGDEQAPLLTPAPLPISTNIPDLLASGAPALRQAVATTIETGTRQAVSVELAQVACVPLTTGRVVVGALILAQQRSDGVSAERARGALDLMGFWLSNAVEAHLESPSSEEGDLDRLSALCRLLGDSATHRSDREIVATFGEALAIWHDLEVFGYVETTGGEFVREVTLAGADASGSPPTVQRTSLPEGGQMGRISRLDVERLGFANGQDLVMRRLSGSAAAWVIVVVGAVPVADLPRLGRYLALLDQSIGRNVETSISRAVASMARHLLDEAHSTLEQARGALDEVQDALKLSSAGLTVSTPTGVALLSIGSAPEIADRGDSPDGRQVAILRPLPQGFGMAMAAEWPADRRVTRHEHQVAHAVADLFESWACRLVRQATDARERRAAPRSYGEDLERFAGQAVEGGIPVTVVVVSFANVSLQPGVTQAQVGRLREQMRPTDLVGRLGEGEIGMLLHNTPGGHARAVTARLRQALQRDDTTSRFKVSIGVASREPGQMTSGALAQEAREDALRDIEESYQ